MAGVTQFKNLNRFFIEKLFLIRVCGNTWVEM